MPVQVQCEECSITLFRYPNALKKIKFGSFCNNECLGKFRTRKLTGEWAANYKSGSRRSRDYIEVEAHWHPTKNHKGYIALHRLIAEVRLGRFLSAKEVVHHIDHDPRNNHWNNLQVMSQSEHSRIHSTERRGEDGKFSNKKGH